MDSSTTVTRPALTPDGPADGQDPAIPYLRWVFAERRPPQTLDTRPRLADAPLWIGRSPIGANTIELRGDHGASRRHARVDRVGDGLRIEDLGSKNGVFVDGQRIAGPTSLRLGQVVRIGSAVFVVGAAPMKRRARLLASSPPPADFVAASWSALALWEGVVRAAGHRDGVLLRGELGTGKTRVAEHIHRLAGRGEFVSHNSAALLPQIDEATLFGIAAGTATGVQARVGLLRRAAGGTLLLDEFADLPPSAQAKLLDAFDPADPSFLPPGASRRVRTQCRLIVASNRPVEGVIRPDLLSRIVITDLTVPPLRARRECLLDILYRLLPGDAWDAVVGHAERAEALLLAPWWENVRGLTALARRVAAGEHLDLAALTAHGARGTPMVPDSEAPVDRPPETPPAFDPRDVAWPPTPEQLLRLMHASAWNNKAAGRLIERAHETVSRQLTRAFGGQRRARQAWDVWQVSGRIPARDQIERAARLYAAQPMTAALQAARDAWRGAGALPA